MNNKNAVSTSSSQGSKLLDLIVGWTLYPLGDLIGQLILGEFDFRRLIVLALVGGLIYRFEIPWWFRCLDRYTISRETCDRFPFLKAFVLGKSAQSHLNWLGKTTGATVYFNPLWIARHMFFLTLATAAWSSFSLGPALTSALIIGSKSFLTNLPIAFAGNYIIQERMPYKHRFLGSAILTTILTVKYAIEYVYFA